MANEIVYPYYKKWLPLMDSAGGPESQIACTIDSNGNIVLTSRAIGNAAQIATNNAEQAMSNQEYLLATVNLIDLNSAAEQVLYTAPAGITAVVITRVVNRKASTSVTTASWGYGWNSGTDTDVIASATHTELTGATLYTILIPKTGAKLGAASGTFSVKTTIQQGGACTITNDVFGYIVP